MICFQAWEGCEYRWRRSDAPKKALIAPWPEWQGQDIRGKRIIVFHEQGLGDTIQFARYLTRLASDGAQVSFLIRPAMHRVLKAMTPAIRLIDKAPPGESFDFQAALLSLPCAYRTISTSFRPVARIFTPSRR